MYGVMLAVVARNGTRLSELVHFHGRRAQQRAVEGAEALDGRPGDGRRTRRHNTGDAQLCIELGVTRLEDTDQRALSERLADGLHFGELVAAAEYLEKRHRLAFGSVEDPQLEENDGPGCDGKENQDQQNGLLDRAGTGDHLKQVMASSVGPAVPLYLHEQKQAERTQTCLRVICKSAAGTARMRQRIPRSPGAFKSMLQRQLRRFERPVFVAVPPA